MQNKNYIFWSSDAWIKRRILKNVYRWMVGGMGARGNPMISYSSQRTIVMCVREMKFNNIHDFLRCFARISASFAIESERDRRCRVYLRRRWRRRRPLVYTVVLNLTDGRRRSVVMRRGKRRENIEPIIYDAISAYFLTHRPRNLARRTCVFTADTYFLTSDFRFVVFSVFSISASFPDELVSEATRRKTEITIVGQHTQSARIGFTTSLVHVRVSTNRLYRYVNRCVPGHSCSPGNRGPPPTF